MDFERDLRASAQLVERDSIGNLKRVSNDLAAVSVTVAWGDEVLRSCDLSDQSVFRIGVDHEAVDFAMAEEQLGAADWQLVTRHAAAAVVRVPMKASGFVEFPGESLITLEALRPQLLVIEAGHQLELPYGGRAVLRLGLVTFEISHAEAEAPWARTLGSDFKPVVGYFAASLVSTAALMAGMAFFVPPMGLNDGEQIDSDRVYLLQQYLDAAAEREELLKPADVAETAENAGGKDGARAQGDEGAMGKPEAAKTNGKIAVKGPADNPHPELSLRAEAATFGMIGLLAGGTESDGLTAPWARDSALGADPTNAMGAMWGDNLSDNAGNGGLGLIGLAEGGGGHYEGIGLSDIGTIGTRGDCVGAQCFGVDSGFGRSHGLTGHEHVTKGPRIASAPPTVSGRLPPQTIQRIVRQNFGRFRICYEKGLTQNPNLQGRVQVRFMIDRSGMVSNVMNSGSALPNSEVVSCVVHAFYGLSFPKPDMGSVQVSYPIMFNPE
jgi:hypothetical protein